MDNKKVKETYGMDVANVMEEGKKLGQPMDVNNAISIADQKAKEQAKQPKPSFPSQEEIAKTHKYVGEIELEGGNGNYWTVLQGPKGFIAGSPTNNGIMFDTDYFESIEELYEFLQQNPKYKEEEPYPDNLKSKFGK